MASKTTQNHNSSDVLTFELEGLEVRVSSNVKDDFEILEAAARVDDNPTAVIDLLKLLFGDNQYQAVKDHLRSIDGYVSSEKVMDFLKHVLNGAVPN